MGFYFYTLTFFFLIVATGKRATLATFSLTILSLTIHRSPLPNPQPLETLRATHPLRNSPRHHPGPPL